MAQEFYIILAIRRNGGRRIIKSSIFDPKVKFNNLMSSLYRSAFHFCLVSFIVCTSASCKGKPEATAPKPNPATVVDVMVVSFNQLNRDIEANGTVVANEFVELHPEVSGRLTYLNVPEGKSISKGTVIARINDADLRAQLGKSRVQLDLAQKTEQRYKQLLDIQGLNQSDYDAALNAVNGFKADIAYTQSLIDKTVIRAPFSGIVGLRQVSPGAFVGPSNIIATIQQIERIKVDFTIPEEYSDLIKTGRKVQVEVDDANPHRESATIIAAEPQVNTSTRNLKVRAMLDRATGNPGAFVKVFVSSGKDAKALLIPTNAIIQDDVHKQVIVVKQGKADFRTIETGVRETNAVEVTKGLNVGDSVVVTGVLFARPKSQLKVRSVKTMDQLGAQKS
jgi:membrane fusion protein, multidrug efflux system